MLKELFGGDYEMLLNNDNILEKTMIIVEKTFRHVKDKQGMPYIGHLLRVCNRLSKIDQKIVGLLHDIVEDTEVTFADLRAVGYPDDIIEAIGILTKKDSEDNHFKRVKRLLESNNMLALVVKKADIEDNMDETRLKELEAVDFLTAARLREKYRMTYERVNECLKGEGGKNVRY